MLKSSWTGPLSQIGVSMTKHQKTDFVKWVRPRNSQHTVKCLSFYICISVIHVYVCLHMFPDIKVISLFIELTLKKKGKKDIMKHLHYQLFNFQPQRNCYNC